MDIRVIDKKNMTKTEAEDITKLLYITWGDKNKDFDLSEALLMYNNRPEIPKNKAIAIYLEDKLIAHAEIGQRKIETNNKIINNMFLAGVCVHPDFKGQNYGKIIIEKSFEIAKADFDCCIFQTGVPGFYTKLGSVQIYNRFFNSLNKDTPQVNPWWDDNIMIYPNDFPIGNSDIDLKGLGY